MLSQPAFLAVCACGLAAAQPPPAFDVASVRLATGTRTGGYTHQVTPTSLTMLHVSMGHCLRLAYDIHTAYELIGPSWLDPPTENEYDIVAKVDHPVSEPEIRAMLRTLLAARFQLRAHCESRELPVYELVSTKTPAPLRRALAAGPPKMKSGGAPHEELFESFTMADLALQLGPPWTARPVIDHTGLLGAFDFSLDLARYITDPQTGSLILDHRGAIDIEGALLRALPEQLGLALKPGRAPYQVLVVEHVGKLPAAN